MKYLLMLGGVGLGLLLGFMPSISRPKPMWWRILTIAAVTLTVLFSLLPPIGGTLTDVVMASRADSTKAVPFYAVVEDDIPKEGSPVPDIILRDARDSRISAVLSADASTAAALRANKGRTVIVNVRRGATDVQLVTAASNVVVAVEPAITLPYIMGLEERARIIFFHVPMSWTAVVAYLIAMIFGIRYLRSRDLAHDAASAAAAGVGTLYCILATITGAVWAKFNWGSFWNWDPRETSIFVLLLIYFAYFLLRTSIDDDERRARLSSVYGIVAFVTVPFFIFILPRLLPGLHPGSSDDTTAGPLLSPKSEAINPTKQVVFALSLMAFTLIYFWLMNLRLRATNLERTMEQQRLENV